MPAGAWPVASTTTSMSAALIIAAASSVNRVAAMRSRAPADAPARLARAVRRQIGDRGDLDAGRGRHLGQEHRAELAGADQPDAHRPAAPDRELVQIHPRLPFPASGFVAHCYARTGRLAMEWRKLRADQLRELARRMRS